MSAYDILLLLFPDKAATTSSQKIRFKISLQLFEGFEAILKVLQLPCLFN